jgi:hypothetical protein
MIRRWLWCAVVIAGCQGGSTPPAKLAVFHTAEDVRTVRVDGSDGGLRQRVEDFYPAACFDHDDDGDGLPSVLDPDEANDGDSNDGGDDLACRRCNRGPGTQGDFRLEVEGGEAELDRGRVSARHGAELTVPTPDGALVVLLTDETELEDGDPTPGAEVRARGTLDGAGRLVAERLKVLCPGPGAVPVDQVPPEAPPVEPGGDDGSSDHDEPTVCPDDLVACDTTSDCAEGFLCIGGCCGFVP